MTERKRENMETAACKREAEKGEKRWRDTLLPLEREKGGESKVGEEQRRT